MREIRKIACILLCLVLYMGAHYSYADIIKLKRGVSFECRIIDEQEGAYIVELQIGTVEFKKIDVEGIEIYSDIQNMKLMQEWGRIDGEDTSETDTPDGGQVFGDLDQNSLLNIDEDEEKLVKYQGRYVTPEVYEIIKKERMIKERRYKFLEEQRQKKRQEDQTVVQEGAKDKEIVKVAVPEAEEGTNVGGGPLSRTFKFGTRDSRKLGEQKASLGDSREQAEEPKRKNITGKTVAKVSVPNTL